MRSARLKKKDVSGKGSAAFFNQEQLSPDHYEKEADAMEGSVADRPKKPTAIQRFGAAEHKELGDSTGELIDIGGGVQLSFGDIVALAGDEFGTPEEIYDATKSSDGRAKIRAHLEHAKISPDKAALLPQPKDADEKKAQEAEAEKSYYLLALDNISHFSGGGTAFENWFLQHGKAVNYAMEAGLYKNNDLMNRATLTEAFGAHYLTDAFSSGHVRTPRSEINDYYVNEFAPKVYDHLVDHLRERLVDEIYDQVEQQTVLNEAAYFFGILGGVGVRKYMKRKIRNTINSKLDAALLMIGGRSQAITYLGKILGGIVSLVLHDRDNVHGLWVNSKAHPEAWQAFGDSNLSKNPVHQKLIEQAIETSLNDLRKAREIGFEKSQEVYNLLDERYLPSKVYFEFNSSSIKSSEEGSILSLAEYLNYHPTTQITLVGNTDPLGSDDYNDNLGMERALSVKNVLLSKVKNPATISVTTQGEHNLVTKKASRYSLNRRVEILYQSTLAIDQRNPDQIAYDEVSEEVKRTVGPPYAAEDHFPHEAPQMSMPGSAAQPNPPIPEWKWGSMDNNLKTELNDTLKGYLGSLKGQVTQSEMLKDETVEGYTVSPKPIVEKIFNELSNDPMSFLEKSLGRDAN
ncbi:MAG: OmpA family protein [Chitinophagaceae bacterium]|nr:OmpA family protein [Chitinophagaceae bacterium]